MKRIFWKVLALFLMGVLLSDHILANTRKVNYELTKVSEHAYVITRSWDQQGKFRNNVGFVVGERGITLINGMYGRELEQLLDVIRQVSDKPIEYIFNSNWDFHNTDANAKLAELDATIISHQNLKYFEKAKTHLTFNESIELNIGTEQINAYHSGGHSFGHINIYLKNANLMFMSDSYRDQWMTTAGPFGYEGHIKGLKSALDMGDENTKFVPGNTSTSVFVTSIRIKDEINIRLAFIDKINELKSKGLSYAQIANDEQVKTIFAENYERFPEYGKNLTGRVRAGFYGSRVNTKIGNKELLQEFVGQYQMPDGRLVEVLLQEAHLIARSEGAFMFLLLPLSKDIFEFGWHFPDRTFQFSRDKAGKISGFKVNMRQDDERYGQELVLEYLKSVDNIKRLDK